MKPILFNTEMVRAILDGRKTVTRRVVKPQPKYAIMTKAGLMTSDAPIMIKDGLVVTPYGNVTTWEHMPYRPGDVLYVRETWCPHESPNGNWYGYKADGDYRDVDLRWRPSIHMPRDAARIFLRVTGVSVERLQDITEEGAISEGIYQLPDDGRIDAGCWTYKSNPYEKTVLGEVWSKYEGARHCFHWVWDSRAIKPADQDKYGWAANPWVWVIEFERITKEEVVT